MVCITARARLPTTECNVTVQDPVAVVGWEEVESRQLAAGLLAEIPALENATTGTAFGAASQSADRLADIRSAKE